jgi:hypothetical protein
MSGEERSNGNDLPEAVVDEAERLSRLARQAVDDSEAAAYREARADLLADYNFTPRIRKDGRDTLVLYPSEWVVDGTVRPDRVDDIDRGVERPLEGPGEAEEWGAVAEHNREVATAVATEHGEVHGANARALAAFASNHYAKPVEDLTPEERAEFLAEYFPRNAFASDDQKTVVEESVRLVFEVTGAVE